MALPSKKFVNLPAALNLESVGWEDLYSKLLHGQFDDGAVSMGAWAIVSALLELYDYCRTLEQALKHRSSVSAAEGDAEDLKAQIVALEERIGVLERAEGHFASSTFRSIKVLDI
jgi:hypothetical protein